MILLFELFASLATLLIFQSIYFLHPVNLLGHFKFAHSWDLRRGTYAWHTCVVLAKSHPTTLVSRHRSMVWRVLFRCYLFSSYFDRPFTRFESLASRWLRKPELSFELLVAPSDFCCQLFHRIWTSLPSRLSRGFRISFDLVLYFCIFVFEIVGHDDVCYPTTAWCKVGRSTSKEREPWTPQTVAEMPISSLFTGPHHTGTPQCPP